ncbi:helix-turn-helix domain-containing protein [Streptomyces sp. NPDC087843]|uniref:helix-turn-helix domain-containing protein n=1 Tax=Streptomyces sp. NPDC087843 TaxID=3365804 RepID=UPI0037F1A8B0
MNVRRLSSLSGAEVLRSVVADVQQLAEYRYRAVREVLGRSPIGEVAARDTSRHALHTWRRRFEQEGMPGLLDRSRRPRNSPTRLSAEVEAEICELRRRHPRWGARRIAHELVGRGLESAPAPHHRAAARTPGSGAPFYRLVDFADDLAPPTEPAWKGRWRQVESWTRG